MYTLALVSFIAGVLTIIAPCILPVLPLVLAGSIDEDNKWYPYIVTGSLAISIVLFTIILKASTVLLGVPPEVWKYVSGGIILFLGFTYLFPYTWAKITISAGTSKFQQNLQKTANVKSGNLRAILTGAALGPVFSSCSPTYSLLLATVFPVSFIQGIGYTFIYALGLSLMLLIIARGGQKIIKKIRPLADEKGLFRKALGFILVLVAVMIFTGLDIKLETIAIEKYNVNNLEQSILDKVIPPKEGLNNNRQVTRDITKMDGSEYLNLDGTEKAPWVVLPDWINSKPLNIEDLKGKVVIVDFWTYSCINCQRTLPYMVLLDKNYRDKGLVIIGVHAPEFAFEHVKSNVENAVKEANIKYPVVLDNNFEIWNAYDNMYWPAKYIIDKEGKLRYYHFGEGGYDETEKVVQYLLGEGSLKSFTGSIGFKGNDTFSEQESPETYLGTLKRDNMINSSSTLKSNEWSLSGTWKENNQYISSVKEAKLSFLYNAKDVYLVLSGIGTVKVNVDGKTVNSIGISSKDSETGEVNVTEDRLYHLVSEKNFEKDRLLELEFSPGVKAFAFTFGA